MSLVFFCNEKIFPIYYTLYKRICSNLFYSIVFGFVSNPLINIITYLHECIVNAMLLVVLYLTALYLTANIETNNPFQYFSDLRWLAYAKVLVYLEGTTNS